MASKCQTLLSWIVNRKSVRWTVAAAGWWSLEQDLVASAGLDSWYKTGSRWIGDHWCRTDICWCRKVVAGSGLVPAGNCWCRKVVAGSGLVSAGSCCYRKVVAGSGQVAAGAGRWSLVQDWLLLVVAGAGRWSLLQEGSLWCRTCSCCCCREVVAGASRYLLVPSQRVLSQTLRISPEKDCKIERLVVISAALCCLRECLDRLSE